MTFETFDDALALANDCEYGLTSSLFTENYRLIERAKTELLFGETYINRFHFEGMQGVFSFFCCCCLSIVPMPLWANPIILKLCFP